MKCIMVSGMDGSYVFPCSIRAVLVDYNVDE